MDDIWLIQNGGLQEVIKWRPITVHVITSVTFCLDFGNNEYIIVRNFRARIASPFQVIETPPRITLSINRFRSEQS